MKTKKKSSPNNIVLNAVNQFDQTQAKQFEISEKLTFHKNLQEIHLTEQNTNNTKMNLRLHNLKTLEQSLFYNKSKLTHLDVRNNRLTKLPDHICDLVYLVELRVDYNFIKVLPVGLNHLSHL